MAITIIMASAVLLSAIVITVESVRLKRLEKRVTQLDLDVTMLIQNSNRLDI